MLEKFPVPNHQIDAGDVHVHDAPGANIQVADLAVPHLPLRQPHEWPAGVNQRVGILAQQPVIDRLAGQRNGVSFGFGSVSPAVENDENKWFGTRHVLRNAPRVSYGNGEQTNVTRLPERDTA